MRRYESLLKKEEKEDESRLKYGPLIIPNGCSADQSRKSDLISEPANACWEDFTAWYKQLNDSSSHPNKDFNAVEVESFPEEVWCDSKASSSDPIKKEMSESKLKLNLNYQEVIDAWSNRGSLWASDHFPSGGFDHSILVEEERARRETSVLRYKEKRQLRLFSKKIRYQVRKLNADKRPRLKGRFVKRASIEDGEYNG